MSFIQCLQYSSNRKSRIKIQPNYALKRIITIRKLLIFGVCVCVCVQPPPSEFYLPVNKCCTVKYETRFLRPHLPLPWVTYSYSVRTTYNVRMTFRCTSNSHFGCRKNPSLLRFLISPNHPPREILTPMKQDNSIKRPAEPSVSRRWQQQHNRYDVKRVSGDVSSGGGGSVQWCLEATNTRTPNLTTTTKEDKWEEQRSRVRNAQRERRTRKTCSRVYCIWCVCWWCGWKRKRRQKTQVVS